MFDKLPGLLYHTRGINKQPLRPTVDASGELMSITAWLDRAASIEQGVKDILFTQYGVTNIDVLHDGMEWVLTLDRQAPFLTRVKLSLGHVYVFEIIPTRTHGWVYDNTSQQYASMKPVSEIRRTHMVSFYDYFVERRVVINHPRMR